MNFSIWLKNRILTEASKKKGSVPNHMPKTKSNSVKYKVPKQRIPKGMDNTTFRPRPKTRGQENREALDGQ